MVVCVLDSWAGLSEARISWRNIHRPGEAAETMQQAERKESGVAEFDEVAVRVPYTYSEDYVPRRCRNVRTRWYSDRTTSTVRVISSSEVEPAFRITSRRFRQYRDRQPWRVDVFRFDGQLWWEVPFSPWMPDKESFFLRVEQGQWLDQLAIGRPCDAREINQIERAPTDQILVSTEQSMERRAHGIRNNLLVIDDQLAIRGGEPLWIRNRSSDNPYRRMVEVVNSGIEFGKPAHVDPFPPFHWDDPHHQELQAAAADGFVFSLPMHTRRRGSWSPIWTVNKLSDDPLQVDHIHFQAKAGLRQLAHDVDRLIRSKKLPKDLANSVGRFANTESYVATTIEECVSDLSDFANWCEQLAPGDGRRLAEVHSFARRLVASISRRCRSEGRNLSFNACYFDEIDEQAISGL